MGLERLLSLFLEVKTHVPSQLNEVYLTFDDGPHPEITPWVLDVLDQYQAKATFFCLGKNVEKYPSVYEQILKKGHSVGNHSYSHPYGGNTNTQIYVQDVDRASKIINSTLFRPPYGRITPRQYWELKKRYSIVLWDVLSQDYDLTQSPEKIIDRVLKKTKPGSIIVFHDSDKASALLKKTLPFILEQLIIRGFCSKAL